MVTYSLQVMKTYNQSFKTSAERKEAGAGGLFITYK